MMVDSFNTGSPLLDFVVTWGLRIGLALVIFFVGRIVVNWIVRLTERYLRASKLDELIIRFATNILTWTLLFIVIIAALSQLGIDTTAFIALLGAAGLAVGLALQDSMKNFASGVLLIIFRPFTTGHFVEAAGTSGIVESITLFTSTLRTPDNRAVIVPNGEIYSNTITNYSALPTRRVDMVFGIGYDDDLRKAKELLHQIIAGRAAHPGRPGAAHRRERTGRQQRQLRRAALGQHGRLLGCSSSPSRRRSSWPSTTTASPSPIPQMDVHVQNGAAAGLAAGQQRRDEPAARCRVARRYLASFGSDEAYHGQVRHVTVDELTMRRISFRPGAVPGAIGMLDGSPIPRNQPCTSTGKPSAPSAPACAAFCFPQR